MEASVTYHAHSGFSVVVGDHLLLFDYWRGGLPTVAVKQSKYPMVFASHSHHDHYNPEVLTLLDANPDTQFVFSDDIEGPPDATFIAPGDVVELGDATIRAFDSTDMGVSTMVETEGVTVFHAGDLNLWHWRDERGEQEVMRATREFHDALEPIVRLDKTIDIAFFPVDQRLGTDYAQGAREFLHQCNVRHFFPMHAWEQVEAAERFKEENSAPATIYVPKHMGMQFDIEL